MIKNNSIIKSFSWIVLANLLTKPLWFILFIFAARRLGSEEFGVFTYASSIASILGIFIDLGLDYISTREISRDNSVANDYFNKVLFLRIFLFTITLLFLISTLLLGGSHYKNNIAIIILLLFQSITIIITFFKSIVSSFQNFELFSKLLIIEKFLIIVMGSLSLFYSNSVIDFLLLITIGNVTACFVIYLITKNKFSLQISFPNINVIKGLFYESLPLLFLNLFIVFYFRIDVVILNFFTNEKSVLGIYGSIHRLLEMYLLIPSLIMSLAYPIITKNYHSNFLFVQEFVNVLIKVFLIISIPIAVLISCNSYNINLFIFGEGYSEGSKGLFYIIWTIIPLGLNFLLGNLLVAVKKEKLSAFSVGIASIISIVLNLILIPVLSFVGTSIVAVIVEFLILFLYTHAVLKYFGKISIIASVFRGIGVAVTSLLIIYFANVVLDISLVLNLAIGTIIIVVLINLWGVVNLSEIKKMLSVINIRLY
ncbi:MAG TPA: oligosaccharide flippase family protein [Ignavibacteriaceae bacterium]|nr:oligosaccharide flippase family protein [Ignavibacteriaceae bacterium]